MDGFNVYKDMKARTNGEIYIGVVGPVRTGKSTFIKRFMDLIVLPRMTDVHSQNQAKDELPQSASGKTIMTTEPKFIPKEAVSVEITKDIQVKIRLIDCVGFMVEGASGHMEDEKERMVKTPWFPEAIPFTRAASIGTGKVISEHSTIGLVITCDGSFGELPREAYEKGEAQSIGELKKIGKPFLLILNSAKPLSEETEHLRAALEEKYKVICVALNCDQLRKEDITGLMEKLLLEFPVSALEFYTPKWLELLPAEHPIKTQLLASANALLKEVNTMNDIRGQSVLMDCSYIKKTIIEHIDMATGKIRIQIDIDRAYYYEMLTELLGQTVHGEYEFFDILKSLVLKKNEFEQVSEALTKARNTGYGIVSPSREDIVLEEPVVIKHGSKYGVKIKANAPSIHMIAANIETEIAPIVGNQTQAQDLITYIQTNTKDSQESIWDTLIFGKSIGELVADGISDKFTKMTEGSRQKMQESLQKIINDSNGGVIFIII